PSVCSPTARSIARAVRDASGMVTSLPPLRVIVSVRCQRSRPRCSTSARVASETRSPFSASSEIAHARPAKPGGDEQRAELVAVQADDMGLIIQARPPDMGGWRVLEELLFNGVLVEPGDGAQLPGHGGAGASPGFQLPGEASGR